MAAGIFLAPTHKSADGGGRGVQNAHAILGDHIPETIPPRVIRRTLVHHRGRPVSQRAVDDIAVAGDPANIGGAPVNVILFQVENPLGGGLRPQQIPRRAMDNPLGLARGAAGIQQKQQILAVHRLRRAGSGLIPHQIVPPDIPSGGHPVIGAPGAPQHYYLFNTAGPL